MKLVIPGGLFFTIGLVLLFIKAVGGLPEVSWWAVVLLMFFWPLLTLAVFGFMALVFVIAGIFFPKSIRIKRRNK